MRLGCGSDTFGSVALNRPCAHPPEHTSNAAGGYLGVRLSAAPALDCGVGSALTVGLDRRSLRDGHRYRQTGNRRRTAGVGPPALSPGERLTQVRHAITTLRDLDGTDLHTPVVMAARGPKARPLAFDLANSVTFAAMPEDSRAVIMRMRADVRAVRTDIELAHHVPVVGDAIAAFMTRSDTDPAALHAAESLLALPGDPTAAVDEVLRRCEEGGASYFVIGRRRRRCARSRGRRMGRRGDPVTTGNANDIEFFR